MNPFTVEVYDKAFVRQGWANAPTSLTVTVRHNLPSTAVLVYSADHPKASDLATPGARVVIRYQGAVLLSGMVRLIQGEGPGVGVLTFTVVDDFRILQAILGWPVPTAGLGAQVVGYDVHTGPAETVVKDVVDENATRLSLPVTVATDLARGATVTWSWRFHPLLDRMALDAAGIGVTVQQDGAGLEVDCYEPATYPRVLSEVGGAVTKWAYSLAAPAVTRVVAGNQGEAETRVFRSDTDAAAETEWGDVSEAFMDARDTTDATETDLRMAELLAENTAKAGLSVSLAETAVFKYDPTGAQGVRVGDLITMHVGPGLEVTDVLREAALTWTVADGLRVEPQIGDRSDDPNTTLVRAVGWALRRVRDLGAR